MSSNFLENNVVINATPTAEVAQADDLWDGNTATILNSDVISLKNADGAVFIITTGINAAGGTASVRICACDDTTPTTTVAVSFRYQAILAPNSIHGAGEATSYLTSTVADMCYVFEVDAAKVAEQGYEYVYLNADEVVNQIVEGQVATFLTGLRYKEDDIGTQVG